MKKFLAIILSILCVTALFVSTASAATVFEEYFDTLTVDEDITTSNTNFDYVRRTTIGAGTITAEQAASGEMHMRFGGGTSTSLTGVGIQSSLGFPGGLTVTSMNFRLNLDDTNGDIFIGMGSGTTFTLNSTFTNNHLMWAIQSNNGNLEYRVNGGPSGMWNNVGQTLTAGQNYEFHIVANNSGAPVNYGANSVANGRMDLYIDGTLVGNDLVITNNVLNATGFRIYQINGGSFARLDSITIDDTAVEPFTPTAVTLQSFNAAPSDQFVWLVAGILLLSLSSLSLWWLRRAGNRCSTQPNPCQGHSGY